jgi:hypothetical protein
MVDISRSFGEDETGARSQQPNRTGSVGQLPPKSEMDLCRIGESDLRGGAGNLQAQSVSHVIFLGMEKVLFASPSHHPVALVSISAA